VILHIIDLYHFEVHRLKQNVHMMVAVFPGEGRFHRPLRCLLPWAFNEVAELAVVDIVKVHVKNIHSKTTIIPMDEN